MPDDFELVSPEFLKRWREQSGKEYDLRTPEGQMAEFGDAVMIVLSDHWTENEADPMETLDRLLYVPGDWFCPKCGFRLHRRLLNPVNLATGVDVSTEAENCPNDGELMRRLTWKQDAEDANRVAIDFAKQNRLLRERLDELDPRH